MSVPARQIRARYSIDTITVYQAYPPQVALPAVAAGRFVAPFKRDRMTWIKPSFSIWEMMNAWACLVGKVERGYGEYVDEYTNDLYCRDWLDKIWPLVTHAVRAWPSSAPRRTSSTDC